MGPTHNIPALLLQVTTCTFCFWHVARAHANGHTHAMLCVDALCIHHECIEQLKTISHAMFDCHAVQPVIAWLCDTGHALAGEQPPLDARAVLWGEPWVWPASLEAVVNPAANGHFACYMVVPLP